MKRPLVKLLALLALAWCMASTYEAFDKYSHPLPDSYLVDQFRWHEDVIDTVVALIVVLACVVYDRWTTPGRLGAAAVHVPSLADPRRWRESPDLRFVLYCAAAVLIVSLPIDLFKNGNGPNNPLPFPADFWSLTLGGGILCPLLGIFLITYDRWRLRWERYSDAKRCSVFGLGLTDATKPRPECGAAPALECPAHHAAAGGPAAATLSYATPDTIRAEVHRRNRRLVTMLVAVCIGIPLVAGLCFFIWSVLTIFNDLQPHRQVYEDAASRIAWNLVNHGLPQSVVPQNARGEGFHGGMDGAGSDWFECTLTDAEIALLLEKLRANASATTDSTIPTVDPPPSWWAPGAKPDLIGFKYGPGSGWVGVSRASHKVYYFWFQS